MIYMDKKHGMKTEEPKVILRKLRSHSYA
ncbi:hypothetical protein EMIT0215P_160077 [Pseudomonas serboccidentalis]